MGGNEDISFFEKINDLFEYRGIPELYKLGGIEDLKFEQALFVLQARIYDLDLYLESVWQLDQYKIDYFWSKISDALRPLVPEVEKHEQYLYQISVYLKRELGLRSGTYPLHTTLKHFYYYKSCDVRLIRRLIHERSISNHIYLKPSNWHIYDLVTEINDDVEDVFEDLDMYNCNRLLFDIYFYGFDHAYRSFSEFLNVLLKLNLSRHGNLQSTTNLVILDTLDLLNKQMKLLQSVDFQSAKLFSKIKQN